MFTKGEWKTEELDEILIMSNETTCVARIVKTYFPECQEANANLIAASPKLHKALNQLVWAIESQGSGTQEHALIYAKSILNTLDL